MTHFAYSAKTLSAKGIVRLRQIAKELGVTPSDGRSIQSHVDAILEYQAPIQKVEVQQAEASIVFDDSLEGTLEKEYVIVVNGVAEHRVDGYWIAVRYIERRGYLLIDTQEVAQAQTEFEQHIEDLAENPEEIIDDYFDPVTEVERGSGRDKLPAIGDIVVAGSFILKCSQVLTPDYAVVWDVYDSNFPMGEIFVSYSGFWTNNLSLSRFTTPYEAVADLAENAYQLVTG